jgi:uncharacterized protein YukE
MNLNVAKAQLMDALKQLRARWSVVQEAWDDETRRRFEAEFIEPLEKKVLAAAKGLDQVSELISAVRRDCGDDE